MIKENLAPAIAALVSPASNDEAIARVTDYMIDHPETGLIGCRFADKAQFSAALGGAGWHIELFEVVMSSAIAQTGIFRIKDRKDLVIKGVWHSYNDGMQVINSEKVAAETASPSDMTFNGYRLRPPGFGKS